jgi:hypothetical protein
MIHCNSSTFYVLRGDGNNSLTWATFNGNWPLTINLENNDATFGGNLTAVSNVTAYSDERLKKDWSSLSPTFLQDLAKVKCGTYTRIDSGERQVGASAQDVQKIIPEAVMEDSNGTLSLAYGNAALVAVIKLTEEVLALKEELRQLKENK